jgi:biotin operon repressor
MASNAREAVLSAIIDGPGRSRNEIAEASGVSITSVSYHLTKLRQDGLVVTSDGQWWPVDASPQSEPEPLDLCVWKDGSINLKRGELGMYLDPKEVVQVFEFITRSIPHLLANGLNSELAPESRQLLQRLLPPSTN